jgi:hypothetical protein
MGHNSMSHGLAGLRGYFVRMRGYLREMFPPATHFVIAAITGLGIAGYARVVHGLQGRLPLQAILVAGWNVFAISLILRLMDELKDRDIDRQLFPERALPSGRVRESDIRISLAAANGLYLATNAWSVPVLAFAAATLGYAWLMYARFFAPAALKRSLPITLATHTPIAPLLLLQAFAAAGELLGVPVGGMRWSAILPYVAMLWAAILGWELARKIRAPEEETAYVTYSKILGAAGSVAAAAAAQAASVLLGVYLYAGLGLPAWYPAALAGAWLVCAAAYARFLLRPGARSSRLKPVAAAFAFTVLAAQALAFAVPR